MDTINAKILEIRNDHGNVFHLTLEVEIPNGVALIRIAPTELREDLLIDFRSRQPTDPRRLIGITIGAPAMKVGDIVAIQVFYDNEVVQKYGRTVPISESH
jgi:hypothetical protein